MEEPIFIAAEPDMRGPAASGRIAHNRGVLRRWKKKA